MPSADRTAQVSGRPSPRERARRIAPYAIILAAANGLFYLTGKFDYDKMAASLGPDAWPRLILGLATVACVFEIVRLALFWRGEETVNESPLIPVGASVGVLDTEEASQAPVPTNMCQASAAFASIVGYVLVLGYAGFFLATFAFLTIFGLIAGYRRIGVLLAVVTSLTIGFMFLFMRVIYVSLPIGVEPFSKVSLLMLKLLGVS